MALVDDAVQAKTLALPALEALTMAQAFLHTIASRGDAVALRTSDGAFEIRYDELTDRMAEIAAALAAHGVLPGDTVE